MINQNIKYKKEFVDLLMKIDDPKLLFSFLEDVLTPGEFIEISKRLQIVKRLKKGDPQRKIAEDLGLGIATVTRGSREMLDKKGGFNKILDIFYS